MKKMINRFFSGLKRALGLQETISVVYVAIMLLPNLFLAVTEPYSWSTVLGSILLPATFYLLVSVSLPRPGGVMLCTLPLMILGAFQIVLLYLFGGSIIAVDMFTNLTKTAEKSSGLISVIRGRRVVGEHLAGGRVRLRDLYSAAGVGGALSGYQTAAQRGFSPSRAVGGGGVFRARRDFRARFDVRPSGIRREIPCFSDQRDL